MSTPALIEPDRAGSLPQVDRAERSSLAYTLELLKPMLCDEEITEICINRPGEVFLETRSGWRCEPLPRADLKWCYALAKLTGNASRQRISETQPLLSASLPGGERVQIVMPPATTAGCIAITIRKPSVAVWSLAELNRRGIFRLTACAKTERDTTEAVLLQLLASRRYEAFLSAAVRARKNIIVSGPTGSGKTTGTKALIQEIPSDERLITIEDARELVLDRHPNHVRLYYSKDDQGLARVTPRQLLECCLRMRPDRILLAELRSDEAWEYLRNVNSGHPGSITSVHAGSAELALEQLTLLVKQSQGGQALAREDIKHLLYLLVDIVVQFGFEGRERVVREIWYDPERKYQLQAACLNV
jgi:type IV secretion system protein VirB11